MRESTIEARLAREVRKLGGLCYKFTSPGAPGVPDRIIILPGGLVVFVELKTSAPFRKRITPHPITSTMMAKIPTFTSLFISYALSISKKITAPLYHRYNESQRHP